MGSPLANWKRALLLAAACYVTSAGDAAGGSFSATCIPQSGDAPLVVVVDAVASPDRESYDYICASIDFGDGDVRSKCDFCYFECDPYKAWAAVHLVEPITYACPGVYSILAYADPAQCANCQPLSWQVTVTAPQLNLTTECDPRETTCRLSAVNSIVDTEHIVRSTVDWGDGSLPEEFTWIDRDGWYQAPSHDFGRDGNFIVRVVNEIAGTGCSWRQTAMVIANPGYTTPTTHTTWGKIKALYAR